MKSRRKRAVRPRSTKLREQLLETRSEFLRMIREYPELCCADADAVDFSTAFDPKLDHRRYIVRPPRIH